MNCPSCGAELPGEAGQHAVAPAADIVDCPTCGARVDVRSGRLAAGVSPEGHAEEQGAAPIPEGRPDSSVLDEMVEDVMEEIERKEQP